MALSTLSPLAGNTNIITTNFSTLPFLTLGNATTDLPFLVPDPSIFSTDPPSFISNNQTFTDYDYTFDNNGTEVANSSSSNDNNYDSTTEEEINPFLAMDYNFYDYNPYDPNATFEHEPYDYSELEELNPEENEADRAETKKKWDGVNFPPPIRGISYNALTDLNPWFLWTPPIFCFLSLIFIVLPCIILKLKDDLREKKGLPRKYGSTRRKSILRRHTEQLRAEDLEHQTATAAGATSHPGLPGGAYSDIQYVGRAALNSKGQTETQVKNGRVAPGLVTENVLYIEENDLSMKKENGKLGSKRLPMVKPPLDYTMEEEIRAAREALASSKEEGGKENLELHRHSSRSGSFTPTKEAAASGESSLGSSSGPERRAEGDEVSEEDEEVKAHRSGNFSTAPKTYSKLTGWNRDLYSNGTGFGPPARKSSSREEGGSPPVGSADPDWGMY